MFMRVFERSKINYAQIGPSVKRTVPLDGSQGERNLSRGHEDMLPGLRLIQFEFGAVEARHR